MSNPAMARAAIYTIPSVNLTLSPPQSQKWKSRTQSPAEFNTTKKRNLVAASSNSPVVDDERVSECNSRRKIKDRVFFLDVNPLCYKGNNPSLLSFANWISLFFSQVSLNHPVIAVICFPVSKFMRLIVVSPQCLCKFEFSL